MFVKNKGKVTPTGSCMYQRMREKKECMDDILETYSADLGERSMDCVSFCGQVGKVSTALYTFERVRAN